MKNAQNDEIMQENGKKLYNINLAEALTIFSLSPKIVNLFEAKAGALTIFHFSPTNEKCSK